MISPRPLPVRPGDSTGIRVAYVPFGTVIHYTEWLQLLSDEGIRVGGKDPRATLLTQINKSPYVEVVRPRSGLYRLKSA